MSKFIKAVSLFLSLIFLFSGCKYQIDENKTKMFNNIEKITSIKEAENSAEIKPEFLKLFEEYAGFSLPEYFILPESTEQSVVFVSSTFLISTYIIMGKNDALEILNKIRNGDEWIGYRYHQNEKENKIEKDKEKCTYFKKSDDINEFCPPNFIELNFHYNNDYDNYTIYLLARLDRKLPNKTEERYILGKSESNSGNR